MTDELSDKNIFKKSLYNKNFSTFALPYAQMVKLVDTPA